MGPSFSVNNSPVKPTAHPVRSLRLKVDVPMIMVVSSLIVIGLLLVYSSSWNVGLWEGRPPDYFLKRQMVWAAIGLIGMVAISLIDYRRITRIIAMIIMAGAIFLLIGALLSPGDPGMPHRVFLGGQPSEIAKMAIVIYLAVWLNSKRENLNKVTLGLFPLVGILAFIAFLILVEPDLSAAATVIFLGGLLFFIAGGDMKQIILVVVVTAILGWLAASLYSTGSTRLAEYLSGLKSPLDASYHVRRSMEAIARGGIFGVGIGKGLTKSTGLPVPWTDSIYAVLVEEAGLFLGVAVIGLYLIFIWRGLRIADKAPDLLGKLLAAGLTLWIGIEAFVNIGVMVNLVPFAGNALPLISYGGSSLATTMIAIGIVMSVSRANIGQESETGGKKFGAVVDLRRRDRRRRVSRTIDSTSNR